MNKKEQNKIIINGNNLKIEDVVKVARFNHEVELSDSAIERINRSRESVEKILDEGKVVYGLTTGFGSLANVNISKQDTEILQKNLIMSHAVGVGKPLREEIVRAIMLLRINTFAKGFSGIRMSTVKVLIDMLNKKVFPMVPEKGSVGSSGDLAPLSHMVLVMMGMGEAFLKGKKVTGAEAMKKAGIKPVKLTSKEGLALNNGTPVMTAMAVMAIHDSENLLINSVVSSSLTFEALKANSSCMFERVHLARPHLGQIKVASMMRNLLRGSNLIDSNKQKVQDAYSIRATPVVIGASLDAMEYVKEKVMIEINSATDNPLIFKGEAHSAANFHGQPIALAMDFLGIAVSELANISERRISRILDPALNEGLPAFLIQNSGVNNGFMIPQYTAAALVSDNKVLAHPSSVDSVPTCANQEDHVSMGTTAARKCLEIIDNTSKVIAIELMIATQGVEMRKEDASRNVRQIIREIRKEIEPLKDDRVMYPDIHKAEQLIRQRKLSKMVDLKKEDIFQERIAESPGPH